MFWLNKILEFIFPSKCVACNISGSSLCNSCFEKLEFNPKYPSRYVNEDIGKSEILYFYNYNYTYIKEIIKKIKYHNDINVYKLFGEKIRKYLLENKDKYNIINEKEIYIIPIPLYYKDNRIYNHSKILAKNTRFNVVDILEKTNKIKQAHTKNRKERLENILGKIKVKSNRINNLQRGNKFIILLDDVFTTGSTMLEAGKVLEKEGIKVNLKICLAH